MALLLWGLFGLAPFGQYPGPYGDVLNAVAPAERHIQNVVTAVMFDYRGFDTLGEEFILFASVTGVILLMRYEKSGPKPDSPPDKIEPPPPWKSKSTELTRLAGFGFLGPILVFGIDVVLTGHLSVGGGFQGGVILSGAWTLLWLVYGPEAFKRVSETSVLEWFEAGGAGAYVLIGAAALLVGQKFMTNILPLGQTGQLLSSGTILLINCAVGIEVTAGFVLLLVEFFKPLEQEQPLREP
jgi:multicomponent Na+:H+ antiporter subunit B